MLPPGLLMSSSPIVVPVMLASRGAAGEDTRGVSSRGFTSVVGICLPSKMLEQRTGAYWICDHLAAARAGRPASDDRRELACGPPGNQQLDRRRVRELQVTPLAIDDALPVDLNVLSAFAGPRFVVTHGDAGVFEQKLAHGLFCKAVATHCSYVLG